jgi:sugar/nucleoside kinase (ribokinase family)
MGWKYRNKKNMNFSICIFGDVNVDVFTSLEAERDFKLDDPFLKHILKKVEWLPGGTGTIIANAAMKIGFKRVRLIAKVGADKENPMELDIGGKFIRDFLQKRQIEFHGVLTPLLSTGTVLILYLPDDRRIMIADAGANKSFTMTDLSDEIANAVAQSDFFFVSGYSLLIPERLDAVKKMMEIARENKKIVILDLVPHEIYNHISIEAFHRIMSDVDLIISETNTIKRFLYNQQDIKEFKKTPLREIGEKTLKLCNVAILRPDNYCQYLMDSKGMFLKINTRYETLTAEEKRGFSESLSLSTIVNYYGKTGNL